MKRFYENKLIYGHILEEMKNSQFGLKEVSQLIQNVESLLEYLKSNGKTHSKKLLVPIQRTLHKQGHITGLKIEASLESIVYGGILQSFLLKSNCYQEFSQLLSIIDLSKKINQLFKNKDVDEVSLKKWQDVFLQQIRKQFQTVIGANEIKSDDEFFPIDDKSYQLVNKNIDIVLQLQTSSFQPQISDMQLDFLKQILQKYFFDQILTLITKVVPQIVKEQMANAQSGINPAPEVGVITGKSYVKQWFLCYFLDLREDVYQNVFNLGTKLTITDPEVRPLRVSDQVSPLLHQILQKIAHIDLHKNLHLNLISQIQKIKSHFSSSPEITTDFLEELD